MRSPTFFTAVAIAFLVGASLQPLTAQAQPAAPSAGGYNLAWSDEFDQDGPPDPAKWDYERGFVRNDELQWYQPENARCENGLLVIEARRDPGLATHATQPAIAAT